MVATAFVTSTLTIESAVSYSIELRGVNCLSPMTSWDWGDINRGSQSVSNVACVFNTGTAPVYYGTQSGKSFVQGWTKISGSGCGNGTFNNCEETDLTCSQSGFSAVYEIAPNSGTLTFVGGGPCNTFTGSFRVKIVVTSGAFTGPAVEINTVRVYTDSGLGTVAASDTYQDMVRVL